jgi:hypothetical protein
MLAREFAVLGTAEITLALEMVDVRARVNPHQLVAGAGHAARWSVDWGLRQCWKLEVNDAIGSNRVPECRLPRTIIPVGGCRVPTTDGSGLASDACSFGPITQPFLT